MFKNIIKIVVLTSVLGTATFYAFKHNKNDAMIDTATQARAEFEDKAKQAHPELSLAEAVQLEGQKRIESTLKNGTQKEKISTAAGDFLGFYIKNTRSRVVVCKDYNVDISPYAETFARIHEKEFAKLDAFFKAENLSAQEVMDMTDDKEGLGFKADIEFDYKQRAEKNQSSIEAECQLFTADYANERHFSIISPEEHNILMGL